MKIMVTHNKCVTAQPGCVLVPGRVADVEQKIAEILIAKGYAEPAEPAEPEQDSDKGRV